MCTSLSLRNSLSLIVVILLKEKNITPKLFEIRRSGQPSLTALLMVLPSIHIHVIHSHIPGADPGGGVLGVRTPPPHFGGPPNFIKREKTLRVGARKCRVLVLNSYPDPPFPKSCIRPCIQYTSTDVGKTCRGKSMF